MPKAKDLNESLQDFAKAVTAKMSQLTLGEPEEQLRAPFEKFMEEAGLSLGIKVVSTGETLLKDRIGKPDFAIHANGLLAGYVELKATGVGAQGSRYKGRNREQFNRFASIPNILYTDGNEWALYRNGDLVEKLVRLSGDVSQDGDKAVGDKDARSLENLLRVFLSWEPIIPFDKKGKIILKDFASLLAPLCRLLRNDVTDALNDPTSPLLHLALDWRKLLFPDAPDEQFVDAYAQTVTFALLLGRSEGADPLTLKSAEDCLEAQHNLLSRALQVLTDSAARMDMAASLDLLLRVIGAVPPATFAGTQDPWLYFYEDFLAAYDPKLRKDAGAYYTPVEVVRCQVRLVDDLLVNFLDKPLGFADPGVVTLDPAAGTGTYLLGVIQHALDRVEAEQGAGAVAGQATALAKNLYGFELMVGPYAVSELRVSRALRDRGATLPKDGTHIYLTDTLESPHVEPLVLAFHLKAISDQHAKALQVKSNVPVIVCIGNPPYDRHGAIDSTNKSKSGGWVHWGDSGNASDGILQDFRQPAITSGHGVNVRNLYNLYVYFWRWALWKVFEHKTAHGPGVVSFITASSYLDGDAFCGMREHMRRVCDEIWILDLGGEGRGTRKTENVFAIQTPVAVAIAVRAKKAKKNKPAKVHYVSIEGTRETKLAALDAITDFSKTKWQDCPDDWQAPFRPAGRGCYFEWPLLTGLMPWQHPGVGVYRTWPICHEPKTLAKRWKKLLDSNDMAADFGETRDRKVSRSYDSFSDGLQAPLDQLPKSAPPPHIERYAFRSFDRQWILADTRVGDQFRPVLWNIHGEKQIYLASSFVLELGEGSGITSTTHIPDRHYFAGRGGKDIVPLYRNADATEANILPGFLEFLATHYKTKLTPENFLAYVYGVLAQPAFTKRFAKELETRELRVPITKDRILFEKIRKVGERLLWLHTYGERFVPKGKKQGQVPGGGCKCTKAIPGTIEGYPESFEYTEATKTLRVGDGEFAPVSRDVFNYEVSGLKVVQSWLKYRMKKGSGKKSSPLDDIRPEKWTSQFTTELLELLWVLEATIDGYEEQAKLLDEIVAGEYFKEKDFPDAPEWMRKPPKAPHAEDDLPESEDE